MAHETTLRARALRLTDSAAPIEVEVPPGAIFGLAGLDGHGQETFLECLAGLRKPAAGTVETLRPGGARPITGFREAARSGIVYLPRDRRRQGVFPNLSVLDNFAIASVGRDARLGLLSFARRRRRYAEFRDQMSVVARDPDASIMTLSGGNQQKVLLARLLARRPDVLLLNDPTRGVDIATRATLYKVFRGLAEEGMTLVVLSSEIEEAVGLCDEVLVFRENHLSDRLSGEAKTGDNVIAAMFREAS